MVPPLVGDRVRDVHAERVAQVLLHDADDDRALPRAVLRPVLVIFPQTESLPVVIVTSGEVYVRPAAANWAAQKRRRIRPSPGGRT
ncbi:hypothetical protein GCM10020216_038970 [Nonomuraea helvata]